MIRYVAMDEIDENESGALPILMNADLPSLWDNGAATLRALLERYVRNGCRYLVCFGERSLDLVSLANEVFWETSKEAELAPGIVLIGLPSSRVDDALKLFREHISGNFSSAIALIGPAA